MDSYDRVRRQLKEFLDAPIDDLSIEELLVFRQLAIEIEQTVKEGRIRASQPVDWLWLGKKDGRRKNFPYWGE